MKYIYVVGTASLGKAGITFAFVCFCMCGSRVETWSVYNAFTQ